MSESQTSIRDIEFAEKEERLRADVHTLGEMVGEIIREQGGETLFQAVEAARRAAIGERELGSGEDKLHSVLAHIPSTLYADMIRAFTTWFQVVNTAEQIHRIRRRRAYLRERTEPQRGSLEATFRELKQQGVSAQDLAGLLPRLLFEPVFTAHPTEPTRRTILRKEQRIGRLLLSRLDPTRTPRENQATLDEIRSEITSAWQTDEHPAQRTTVADEQEQVLFYLTDVIYPVIPDFYAALREALANVYDDAGRELPLGTVVRMASWVGGDMEDNPDISGRTIKESLARHRSLILNLYFEECRALAGQLSQSLNRISIDPRLQERIILYREWFPNAVHGINRRHRDMPYRVMFRLMSERVQATYHDQDKRYRRAQEFIDDLKIVAHSLRANKGNYAGLAATERLLRRAETFRFKLATLDIRQEAEVIRHAVGQGLDEPEWMELAPEIRIAKLHHAFDEDWDASPEMDTESRKTLSVFESLALCRRRFGHTAIGPFIISMTEHCDDLLSVLMLARWGGLSDRAGSVPLDVIPLFESVHDLEVGPRLMAALLRDRIYRKHLATREKEQTVMLGFSHSNKEGGLASSRWSMQGTHREIARIVEAENVGLTVFYGRGGTISRGGGGIRPALLAAPPGSIRGRLRSTEQGETINAKYGLPGIALRNMERSVGAIALATLRPPSVPARQDTWNAIMDEIAQSSRQAYRNMVYDDAGFEQYFRTVTPIDVIERMQLGARPAPRRGGNGIEDVRAIPWVFAWTQARFFLPGWFGIGQGLGDAIQNHGLQTVREMYQHWPFLQALVDDVEIILAKTDLNIASHYDNLTKGATPQYFENINAEYQRALGTVLQIKQIDQLLDNSMALQRSIRLRNPYVDPISLLQVDLLRQWRQGGRESDSLLDALMASINGVAEALQNTG